MSFDNLPAVITLLIALSVATERVTEIIKGMSVWLNQRKETPKQEAHRKAALQLLAVAAGIAVSLLTQSVWIQVFPQKDIMTALALGLLASGGSGFWNSMLSYVTSIKNLKQETVERARNLGRGAPQRMPEPIEGQLTP